jgi:Flp pilus assembly CpaF family ATPase
MKSKPEELLFFKNMTSQRFFDEAKALGVTAEELADEETHDVVFNACLINIRTETAKQVAEELDIPITDDQARAIAVNSLVPQVISQPAPLTHDQRKIAKELYFHAVKAAVSSNNGTISDRNARADASRMVKTGERGLTTMYKLLNASGCLIVVLMFTVAAAMASITQAAAL